MKYLCAYMSLNLSALASETNGWKANKFSMQIVIGSVNLTLFKYKGLKIRSRKPFLLEIKYLLLYQNIGVINVN